VALQVVSGFGPILSDVELLDGTIELDLAVTGERSFPGVVWRAGERHLETFFVRPHQTGNPDAIQYTPAFNGVSAWQLYHGDGFWAPISFPLDDWFTIRVVFAGSRAEMFVADLDAPALVTTLRVPPVRGQIGILPGGDELRVARFEHDGDATFSHPPRPSDPEPPGVIREWEVSGAFAEDELDEAVHAEHEWTAIQSEPNGLLDLARVQGIEDGRNTVLARTTIRSEKPGTRLLELGFSDRAVVYLNGVPRFRGSDSYRTRDYRFLGSIGWYDALHLPLEAGENTLVVAVAEDFGGWGVQARLA
jgi:hypothetical protein